MRKIKISSLFIILIAVAGFLLFKFIGPATKKPDEKFLYIKTNTNLNELKQQLLDEKILNTLTWFNLTTKLLKISHVKPGKYEISNGMSVFNLVRMLRNGSTSPVNFVVTKIRTKEQLAGKLGRAFEFDSLAAINFLNNNDSLQPYHLDSNTVMAMVLPLTYKAGWTVAPKNIFDKFYKAFNSFWTEERKQKAEQKNLSPIQVITLASIIDEETNATKEKGNIASVYLNRLDKGMALGADPTVKFALKNFSIKRVLNIHLSVESPYNTYRNKGLPPGPICTPMEETIDAVLNAPRTDYLFFVASSAFDGTHIFTTNYAEHIQYAKIYQAELDKRFAAKASQ